MLSFILVPISSNLTPVYYRVIWILRLDYRDRSATSVRIAREITLDGPNFEFEDFKVHISPTLIMPVFNSDVGDALFLTSIPKPHGSDDPLHVSLPIRVPLQVLPFESTDPVSLRSSTSLQYLICHASEPSFRTPRINAIGNDSASHIPDRAPSYQPLHSVHGYNQNPRKAQTHRVPVPRRYSSCPSFAAWSVRHVFVPVPLSLGPRTRTKPHLLPFRSCIGSNPSRDGVEEFHSLASSRRGGKPRHLRIWEVIQLSHDLRKRRSS